MSYQAAIFDMDGTILDTLEDLQNGLNHTFREFGYTEDFTPSEVKLFFGSGAKAAIRRALAVKEGKGREVLELIGTSAEPDLNLDDAKEEAILVAYKAYYGEHCNEQTGPYPGIPELIEQLKARGVKVAVVSNKPDPAVQQLNQDYFGGQFDYAAGETPGIRRKPFPDMVAKAMDALGVTPSETVYIGDSEIDLQTARNAGLNCISVDWGFRSRAYLMQHHAEEIASDWEEVLELICQ